MSWSRQIALVPLLVLATSASNCSLGEKVADAPSNRVVDDRQNRTSDRTIAGGEDSDRESRAWYILSQTDTDGLLVGLPERLAEAIALSRREGSIDKIGSLWQGTDVRARARIRIECDGEADGEVFVGFFKDPRWWTGKPAQVRSCSGPGNYSFDDLVPGKYCVGAVMEQTEGQPLLGVEKSWPAAVEISADTVADIQVRISNQFKNNPCGLPPSEPALDPHKADATRLISLRTVDETGAPAPYCRVVLASLLSGDSTQLGQFYQLRTDGEGHGYWDQIAGPFSVVTAQRFGFVPDRMSAWSQVISSRTAYDASQRPDITLVFEPVPSGTGSIRGRVHDQYGDALTEYYISLYRKSDRDVDTKEDFFIFAPVTDGDGRFEVSDLAPGTYRIRVRNFDYPTHVYTFSDTTVVVPVEPRNAVVETNIEVEAKQRLYGRAVGESGAPLAQGSWTARFTKDLHDPWGGKFFSQRFEQDGLFRVLLSKQERDQLLANTGGLIELSGGNTRKRTTIHIDRLSPDRETPTPVVIPSKAVGEYERKKVSAERRHARDSLEGKVPPAMYLAGWIDVENRPLTFDELRGCVVLVDFWGTWCAPCVGDIPMLQELHRKYHDQGLVILGIHTSQGHEEMASFARERGIAWPLAHDVEEQTAKAWEVDSYPSYYLVDRTGLLRVADIAHQDLERAVSELLREKQ
jgi:thiol-disulfide isomerase/thioredoxin